MSKLRAASVAAILALVSAPAHAEPPLSLGTAFYELSLERAEQDSGISALSGRMVDVLSKPLCSAYKEESTLVMELTVVTGQTVSQTAHSVYIEDDQSFMFEGSMSMAGATESTKGRAERGPNEISVSLEQPEAKQFTLPAGTVFPLGMVRKALAAAAAGETSLEMTAYDGLGDGRTLRTISVLIGPPSTSAIPGKEGERAAALGLGGARHWQITFTAFPTGQADATPEYSITSTIFENGFSANTIYDFGRFAMRLDLIDYKPANGPAGCPAD